MAKELKEYVEVSRPAAALHQMSSTRTIRAVIVYTLLMVTVGMAIFQQDIPGWLSSAFLLIVGTYFEEFTKASRREAIDPIQDD